VPVLALPSFVSSSRDPRTFVFVAVVAGGGVPLSLFDRAQYTSSCGVSTRRMSFVAVAVVKGLMEEMEERRRVAESGDGVWRLWSWFAASIAVGRGRSPVRSSATITL